VLNIFLDFQFRDPQNERNNVYHWKSLPTSEERKAQFAQTGNRFTALHSIPGWNTSTSSPPDAMHLLYLGAMNWIVKQVLVGSGMFSKRRLGDIEPQVLFNDCLDRMWMPKNFQRLPPKVRYMLCLLHTANCPAVGPNASFNQGRSMEARLLNPIYPTLPCFSRWR
jgi:hypothetical protein